MRPLPIYAPSASALYLARGCVYPWASGLWRTRPRESTPEARYGQAISSAAEAIVRAIPWDAFLEIKHDDYCDGWACAACSGNHHREARALALYRAANWLICQHDLDEAQKRALMWDIEALAEAIDVDVKLGSVRAEVGYAYDPRLGRVRELRRMPDGRPEPARPGEIRGWMDLEIVTPSHVIVADWKSGRGPIEGPTDSDQLRFLALCAAVHHRVDAVTIELRRIRGGEIRTERAELDQWDLAEIAGEQEALMERLHEPPEPSPGPWCPDCPIVASCPATEALAAACLDAARPVLQPLSAALSTPHDAAQAWGAIARLEAAAERYRAALTGALPLLPEVEIAPGVVLQLCESNGHERIVQTEQAFKIVEDELRVSAHAEGEIVAKVIDDAFSRSTSKERLDEAMRHVWKPGSRGRPAKVQELFDRLRSRSVLKRDKPSVRIEARRKAEK